MATCISKSTIYWNAILWDKQHSFIKHNLKIVLQRKVRNTQDQSVCNIESIIRFYDVNHSDNIMPF